MITTYFIVSKIPDQLDLKVPTYLSELMQFGKMLLSSDYAALDLLASENANHIIVISDSPEICQFYHSANVAVLAILSDNTSFPNIPYAILSLEDFDYEYLYRVYQRHHHLPWYICSSARCTIRETIEEDIPAFYNLYRGKGITDYMEDLFEDPLEELQYLKDYQKNIYGFYGFGMWTVVLTQTGEVIGRVGLSIREGFEEPELGYMIGTHWQQKGIATEVCKAVLNYGKEVLGFDHIRLLMKKGNIASEKLCTKLGFSYTETLAIQSETFDSYHINLQ